MQDEGLFPLQVSRFSVGCCRAGAETGTGVWARAGDVSWPSLCRPLTWPVARTPAAYPGVQRLLFWAVGVRGTAHRCWKRLPPFHHSIYSSFLPFFPDIVVAMWISAVSRKKTLAVGSHFLLRQLGNISEKTTGGRCSHHIPLLHCPLQSPSLSSLLLKAGAGSSLWKEEVLGWSRMCPWLSVASAESTRWVLAGYGPVMEQGCMPAARGWPGCEAEALAHASGWAGSTCGAGF